MSSGRGGDSASAQAAAKRRQAAAAKAARQNGAAAPRRGQPSQTSLTREAKAWQAGAVGEERTARQLARLRGDGIHVLHDRLLDPAKEWNLDHLVTGGFGVVFIDAKCWRGDITVHHGRLWRHYNGGPKTGRQHVPMDREVTKVQAMTARAAERLGYPITAVISLAGTRSRQFEGIVRSRSVTVMSVDSLVAWLRAAHTAATALPTPDVTMLAKHVAATFAPATLPATGGWQSGMAARDLPANAALTRGAPDTTGPGPQRTV